MESKRNQLLRVPREMIPLNIEDLPIPILLDILLRLPVESLGLLTCASKFWYSMISDSTFLDMHLNHRIKNPGYLFVHTFEDPYIIFMERVGDIIEGMKFTLGRSRFRFEKDNHCLFYASSGGLMVYYLDHEKCYYICNPITGEQVKVPRDPQVNYNGEIAEMKWGFSYSTTTREYKLVEYTRPYMPNLNGDIARPAIYTLGSESWREIPNFPYLEGITSTECNGTLYWLSIEFTRSYVRRKLWSIDIETEKIRSLQGPPISEPPYKTRFYYLVRFGDTISCVIDERLGCLMIWILEDKVDETWTRGYDFNYEEAFNFWGLWTNGKLFGRSLEKSTCVVYDTNKKEFRSVMSWCKRLHVLPWQPRNVFFHAGSLVSPTKIMAGAGKLAAGKSDGMLTRSWLNKQCFRESFFQLTKN